MGKKRKSQTQLTLPSLRRQRKKSERTPKDKGRVIERKRTGQGRSVKKSERIRGPTISPSSGRIREIKAGAEEASPRNCGEVREKKTDFVGVAEGREPDGECKTGIQLKD